ncbi:MAG: glycoside hydrolase family 127 protein [Clostridia bacterium]|nr:glycoside hydrolase family 127 protein [Clostridia bacterium]
MNMRNIAYNNIVFTDGFWKKRYELNKDVSIKSVRDRFEETSRFEALRFTYEEGKPKPHVFYDSDVAKWMEGVAYLVHSGNECEEELKLCRELIASMKEHQREDGYMNSYFQQVAPEKIFTDKNAHELYCAGHLLEAAIAYDIATGEHDFLDVMKKYFDYIEKCFIIDKTSSFSVPGHEEIELALLKMYEYCGEKKYLDMAMFFINTRGTCDKAMPPMLRNCYDQNEMPVRELQEAEGHAVRAVYLYTAMAEAARITEDKKLMDAASRLFDNILTSRMYVSGGVGSSKAGEAFTVKYDLPNLEAYSETCAAIGYMLFALAMQKVSLDTKYPEVIERIMHNALLVSTSLDGTSFFYQNPLEIHLASVGKETCMAPANRSSLPPQERYKVFQCSCCPPNINRIFARIGDFFFMERDDALIINQYTALRANTTKAKIVIDTQYPVSGKMNITISGNKYKQIYLRKPAWCDEYTIDAQHTLKDGYIILDACENMDINLDFNMKPYFVETNPAVRENSGKVALFYGPTLYCLERIDNDYDLGAVCVSIEKALETAKVFIPADYYMNNIDLEGYVDEYFPSLYRIAKLNSNNKILHFRPYWTFANRGKTDMKVWIRGTK